MKRFRGGNQADQSMAQQPQIGQYPPPPPGTPIQQSPMPIQYRPPGVPMQQAMPPRYGSPFGQASSGYGPTLGQASPGYGQFYPNVPPSAHFLGASQESDVYLSSMAGLSPTDVTQLRMEFNNYANPYGIIDRDGFRKLYVASLLNKTWDMIEREAETAFRNFDVNQTGGLDFHEYMTACARMLRGPGQSSGYPY